MKQLMFSGVTTEKILRHCRTEPFPFEGFYYDFIISGQQKLSNLLSEEESELLAEEAYENLLVILLNRITNLGAELLSYKFTQFLKNKKIIPHELSCVLYDDFINDLSDKKISLFQAHPFLEKSIKFTVNSWVESTAKFIKYLHADITELIDTFTPGCELGIIEKIEADLRRDYGDGRSALILKFSSGVEIIYKPKDMGMDVLFNGLLNWCNQKNISIPFQPLKILAGDGYGWQKMVRQKSCTEKSAVQRFYHRAGMMSALLFILGAKDCDHNNFVAAGEYPCLIGADILMSPEINDRPENDQWFHDSVRQTSMLPLWNGDIHTTNALDFSPLGNIFPKKTNSIKEWEFINTDKMQLVSKVTVIPVGQNAVMLEDKIVSPQSYLQEIVNGFQEIYQLFNQQQNFLLTSTSPLGAFQHCRSRFHLRSEKAYQIICQQALKPQYLQGGVTDLIDNLLRYHAPINVPINQQPEQQSILQAEIQSLLQQNIPCFSVACSSMALTINQELVIEDFFAKSAYQRLIDRVRTMSPENMAVQIEVIRSSFVAKFAHLHRNEGALQGELPLAKTLSPEDLQEEASKIGHDLVKHAIWDGDGCNWLNLEYMFKANRYKLNILDDSLFTGRAGVSVFLAALGKLSGDLGFKRSALGALEPFRRSIKSQKTRPELMKSEFGLIGLGGTIYSMVKVSEFLQDSLLLEDAVQTAKLVTPEFIASDQKLDIIWGAAGTLLGLISLYQATQDQSILEIGMLCGHHLVANRSDVSPRAWGTIKNESVQPLTGFSHGAAGCSLALLRLYEACGDTDFLVAAQEGIEYERSVFNEKVQNWPDFRMSEKKGEVGYMDTWCHGSSGIGLARLASWSISPSPEVRRDIEIALNTSQSNGIFVPGVDYLCCGNVGRIELLVVAYQLLGDRKLLQSAQESISRMVSIALNGTYGMLPHPSARRFSSGFYKGVAGIGYQLLRTADPKSVPSIIAWH
jgi:type 2 lantibiotic biosynthesis protein LanM